MKEIRVLGIMTGTSCDGIDLACASFRGDEPGNFSRIGFESAPYPAALRARVLGLQKPGSRIRLCDLLDLDRDIGETIGKAATRAIAKNPDWRPHLLAMHGQTIAHHPAPRGKGTTLQAGNAARVAELTGLTVAHRFREGDQAAGGEGAPLAPLFHAFLASRDGKREGVAFHNLGGIGNLTYLAPNGRLLAFDTGPANALIDEATEAATKNRQRFDRGGKIAASAEPDRAAVEQMLLNERYFRKSPPKSTGRDEFHLKWLKGYTRARGAALVSTATELAALSAAHAYRSFILSKKWPLHKICFSGGGAKNLELMRRISAFLPGTECVDAGTLGVPSQEMEALAFAYFGFRTLLGQPLGGEWTGASPLASPASLLPGRNWRDLTEFLGNSAVRDHV